LIIDSHIHLGALAGYYSYDTTVETLLARMDSLGIVYSINSGALDLTYGDFERSYQYDTAVFERSGGRIMSYYSFNPWASDICIEMMERYNDRSVFKGIKIHPSWHKAYAGDERYRAVFEYAAAKALPVMSHTWTVSLTNPVQKFSVPSGFRKYAGEFPGVKLILAHSGGRYEGILEAIALAKEYPNVYCDVAGDVYADRFVETMADSIGTDRLLFGSDYSMMDQRIMLGVVLGADIPVSAKEKILCQNAAALFDLDLHKGAVL
jgi:predicted TIM-barrel fold metal-dependent hydrolase